MHSFLLPSAVSILVIGVALAWTQRAGLAGECASDVKTTTLSPAGRFALGGVVVTAIVLVAVSSLDMQLGLPTAILDALTAIVFWLKGRRSPWEPIQSVRWAILPLVAGLVVMVEALDATGVVHWLTQLLRPAVRSGAQQAATAAGTILAFGSNLTSNLPAGLIASSVIQQLHPDKAIVGGLIIGVDLGPNLSVTASLETILWLNAVRREDLTVSLWQFMRVRLALMPPALLLALGTRMLMT